MELSVKEKAGETSHVDIMESNESKLLMTYRKVDDVAELEWCHDFGMSLKITCL